MKTGLQIQRSPTGISFTVRNPKGQVAWYKFVPKWKYDKNQAFYNARAMAQEKAALLMDVALAKLSPGKTWDCVCCHHKMWEAVPRVKGMCPECRRKRPQ